MNEYLQDNLNWFKDVLPNQCSLFLWNYPETAPFNQVGKTVTAYRADPSATLGFPGIAESVISQIREKSKLKQFLIIGNSMGAGVILWDYAKLTDDQTLSFLLISPREAFMPPTDTIPLLQRTTILAAKGLENDGYQIRSQKARFVR